MVRDCSCDGGVTSWSLRLIVVGGGGNLEGRVGLEVFIAESLELATTLVLSR
jgi:hypothetical protein